MTREEARREARFRARDERRRREADVRPATRRDEQFAERLERGFNLIGTGYEEPDDEE
jgi:hypothetical protein